MAIASLENALLELYPEFLSKNGQKEFAVLPYEEFLRIKEILEDWEDLIALLAAKESEKNADSVSFDETKKL